jgi:S1-C subfamily serine protease
VGVPAATPVQEPGYLGILADESGDRRGVQLIEVFEGGPAEAAGLRVGDIVQSIDGGAVGTLDELGASLTRRAAGEKLAIVVIRGVDALRIDVVLGQRPPPEQRRYPNFGRITGEGGEPLVVEPPVGVPPAVGGAAPSELPQSVPGAPVGPRPGLLGVRVVRVTPELQLAMNLPEPRGALVVEVHPDSPARKAGVPVDAVIVAANGRRVNDPDDLAQIVEGIGPGGSLRLSYYRYGQSFERVVELLGPAAEDASRPVSPAATPPSATPPAGVGTTPPAPSVPTPPEALPPAGPALGAPPSAAPSALPAPKSVTDENERLKARIAELEAQLKAAQDAAKKK